uniref:Uncharacterized protein n=1 Tax=Trypanosoma congolense (strain IL3000) TaxID=1068625 RepID=G0V097_TRYCI|nr:conserved hypothetical protein [Trypanosoma congolense IL3000]
MHVGRNAASDWMRRHTRASTVQQRRTTPAVSSVAARTIAKIIEVGGSNCWAAALQIYAEALATRSVRQDGTVVLFHRHNSIACILDAMPSCVENSNGGSLEGMASKPPPRGFVAGRLAMDIVAPSEGTAPEEWNAAASACRAVLRSLLMTHRLYAARRFARYLMRVRDSHLYGRWALHTIMKAVPHAWEATHRKALLRGGLLDDVVQLTGLDPFVAMALPCEQRERNEEMCYEQTRKSMDREEVDRLVARWCVDAAQQMNTCPWTLCFATDALPRTQTFSREVVSYCCIKLIPMPSVIAGMLPVAVLRDDAIAILRCCIAHGSSLGIDGDCASVSSVVGDSCYTFTGGGQGSVLEVSAVRKLQDVVSVVIDSPRCPSEPVECLGLLFQLLNGSTIINSDHSALTLVSDWWWRQQLRRCIPQHVSTAITWKAVCDAVGLSDLPTRTAPHSFPLLVAQAAHSPDALETLFKVVIEKSGSSLPVDDIPGTCAKNLLYRCKDEKCTPVIDWIVQHCQDHKFMGKFILDNLKENRNTASLVLQRVLHYDRHCNYEIINVLSHMLEASSAGTHLADVCALLPQSQQWALALRCVGSMAAPTIGHVSAAFTALAGGCGEPFALDMALLWKDDTFTWLRANVDPPPSPTQMDDRWEVALRLIAMGTERLKTRPELCRRYVRCLSRSVSVNSRLYAEINTYLTCLLAGSSGLNTVSTSCGDGHEYGGKCTATASAADAPLTKVRLRALVASKRWVEACACASKVGATRDLLELLAQRGRWEETARLVAGAATKRRMACFPLIVRAARLSGCWKAALFTVDKMVSEGVKLHYAVVAELLACCSSANVPLEVVQLWFHKRVVGKDGVSHTLIGLGTSTRSRKGSGGNNSSYDANVIERSGCFNTARDEFLFAALDSSSARFTDQQWCYALQLLREHVLLSGGIPSHRVFRSTFSMLHRARRWRESLQLLQIQRSVGCPPNVKCVRLVLSTLPTTAWRYALEALRTIPPGDSGSVHRVLPVLLPVCWESALGLVAEHGVLTNTVMERIVSCERVPLPLRLHAWRQLLPSLPVSMKHNTAPVYLQLSLAVADNGPCLLNTLDAMCIIEQSIRGLRVDYMNYASFVYYRAQLHRHWCNTNLDPADGVAAFRSLSKIADVEHRCEISAATLEQLSNLVERQRSGCGASVTVTPACSASRSLKHTMPGSDASFTGM